jgi:hypothetical protein
MVCGKRGRFFTEMVFINCLRDGGYLLQVMEHTLNKALFMIPPNLTCFLIIFQICTIGIIVGLKGTLIVKCLLFMKWNAVCFCCVSDFTV